MKTIYEIIKENLSLVKFMDEVSSYCATQPEGLRYKLWKEIARAEWLRLVTQFEDELRLQLAHRGLYFWSLRTLEFTSLESENLFPVPYVTFDAFCEGDTFQEAEKSLTEFLSRNGLKRQKNHGWEKRGVMRNNEAATELSRILHYETTLTMPEHGPFLVRIKVTQSYHRPGFPTQHCKVITNTYTSIACDLPAAS
jgi:hypothetical protein